MVGVAVVVVVGVRVAPLVTVTVGVAVAVPVRLDVMVGVDGQPAREVATMRTSSSIVTWWSRFRSPGQLPCGQPSRARLTALMISSIRT